MAKSEKKLLARSLRTQGLGIKTIAHQLQVSSSSVSLWCRDIILTASQLEILSKNNHDPYYGKRKIHLDHLKELRAEKINRFAQEAQAEINILSKRDLFILGIALYWAEGFKKDNLVGFANTDPAMINTFIHWISTQFNVPKDRFRLRIGINELHKHRTAEIEQHWSTACNIPISQFHKPFYIHSPHKKSYTTQNTYFGTARVRVTRSTDMLRKIRAYVEVLSASTPDNRKTIR